MKRFEDSLPNSARLYTLSVAIASSPLIYSSLRASTDQMVVVILLAVLAAAANWFPIRIVLPKQELQKSGAFFITLGDAVVFISILLFGPAIAALVAGVEAVVGNLRGRICGFYRQVFNVSQFVIATYATGYVWSVMEGQSLPLDPSRIDTGRFFVEAVVCALVYFLLSSSFVAVGIALMKRGLLGDYFKKNLRWAGLTVLSALVAAVVFCSVR